MRELLTNDIMEWQKGKDAIILELPTGTGKTKNALEIIRIKTQKSNSDLPNLILVPEITLIDNFKSDAIKHGFNDIIDNSIIICYASLKDYVGKRFNVICMDECHHAVSDIRTSYISRLSYKFIIGMSATLTDYDKETLFSLAPFSIYKKSMSDIVSLGIVPEPEIRIIEIELDKKIKRNLYKLGKKEVYITDCEYYERLSKSISYWRDSYETQGLKYQKNKMLSEGGKRQRFLGDCKTSKLKELLLEIGNGRAIVFCSSVEQANKVGGCLAISSEKEKKQNQKLIDEFNKYDSDKLFVKSMLKEGTNLVDCRYAIITQLNNKERDLTQQIGRVLRHQNPLVYIIVAKNTVDERFLMNSTKNIREEYIKKY